MSLLRDLRGARVVGQLSRPAARWRPHAGAAWRWWRGELAACLPAALFGPGNVLALHLDGDLVRVEGHPPLPLEASSVPAALRARLRKAEALALVLPAELVLRRVVDVPHAAAREMNKAVPFLVERYTPFLPGQARIAWRALGTPMEGRTRLELAATAASPLEQVLQRLRAMGIAISVVRVAGDHGPPPLDFAVAGPGGGLSRWLREPARALLASSLALALLGPPAVYVAVEQRDAAVRAALLARGARLPDAALAKARLAQQAAMAAVLSARMGEPDPLRVLHEVTEALPDSTWVFSFDLTPGGVRIGGFSADLPAAIARLQALPIVTRLEFASPVIHDAKPDRDRFDILLRLKNFQNAH